MIGGRLLRRVGKAVVGRVRGRVADRVVDRLDEGDETVGPSTTPPQSRSWLIDLLIRVFRAILGRPK